MDPFQQICRTPNMSVKVFLQKHFQFSASKRQGCPMSRLGFHPHAGLFRLNTHFQSLSKECQSCWSVWTLPVPQPWTIRPRRCASSKHAIHSAYCPKGTFLAGGTSFGSRLCGKMPWPARSLLSTLTHPVMSSEWFLKRNVILLESFPNDCQSAMIIPLSRCSECFFGPCYQDVFSPTNNETDCLVTSLLSDACITHIESMGYKRFTFHTPLFQRDRN